MEPRMPYAEPAGIAVGLVADAAIWSARYAQRAFRIWMHPGRGATLRPGKQTLLWNELRRQLRPYVRKRGTQAQLARLLGLPRQRVNDFLTRGNQMPDAERTLELLVWLAEVEAGRQPA